MRLTVSTIAIILYFVMAFDGYAQNILKRDNSIFPAHPDQGIHPELQPDGVSRAGFVLKPRLQITSAYDSNVRATNNSEGDFLTLIKPSLSILKKYDGHIISGFIGADIERYMREQSENKENIEAHLRGHFNINSRWSVPASFSYTRQARRRDIPLALITSKNPENVTRIKASSGLIRRFNRLSLALLTQINDITNDDGQIVGSNAAAIFSDNDRRDITAIARAQYTFLRSDRQRPEHMAFADIRYTRQDFDRLNFVNNSFSGDSGDNNRFGVFAGFETRYKDLLFANISGGYVTAQYDDSALNDVDLFTLSAEGQYALTPKLDLNFDIKRQINQENDFLRGFEENLFAFGVDYELKHNLILSSEGFYSLYDFIDNQREDKNYGGEIGLRYLNSHRLESRLGLGYFERDSNAALRSFDRTRFILSLVGKL